MSLGVAGWLVCANEAEAAIVRAELPRHIALTQAEPGCLSFSVRPDGPLRWRVEESFTDRDALATHQARTAASPWGRATAGIRRDYSIG